MDAAMFDMLQCSICFMFQFSYTKDGNWHSLQSRSLVTSGELCVNFTCQTDKQFFPKAMVL